MNSSEPLLQVRELRKTFDQFEAVRGVSFDLHAGSVVGFIGANGAGKTTTMRMLATLESPDSGSIQIGPWNALDHPTQVRRLIGWMPDAFGTYAHMSVLDYLDFFARVHGLHGAEREERIREVLDFSGLTDLASRPMDGLSKGMAQRLCLGRALLHQPALLLMDEPAAGLDPKARVEFKNAVALLKKQGATLLISSHILSELEEMCDSLLFIDQGRIVHQGASASLRSHSSPGAAVDVDIRLAGPEEALVQWLALQPLWTLKTRSQHAVLATLASSAPETLASELQRMIHAGIPVCGFHPHQQRLEEIFVQMLRSQPTP
ncbi:MAG: hypothetical protein RLZZ244_1566 [Verrucomicrobiota bacterium]|jgi:ABC-2 type transport system ATP-binding protein